LPQARCARRAEAFLAAEGCFRLLPNLKIGIGIRQVWTRRALSELQERF
jgi:hypothetical protein